MTTTVDLAALAAAQGVKVQLLENVRVGAAGTGTDYAGFDDVESVYVSVKVNAVFTARGAPSLVLLLEGSDDGISWSTLETFSFTADATATATVDTPNDHLRVRWTVDGLSDWFVDHVSVAPASLNAAAGGGGGSQPTIYTGDSEPVDSTATVFSVSRVGDPNISGTFTLTFRGDTTAPIGFDAVSEDIANALAALDSIQGAVFVVSGYEGLNLNDYELRFQFQGALLGPTEDPTVTNDTTEFSIQVGDVSTGAAGDPAAPVEFDLFVYADAGLLYMFSSGDTWEPATVANNTITTAKIQDAAVTTGKIADDAVTGPKIAAGAVDTGQLADLAVNGGKIASGAITDAKMGYPVAHLAHGATVNDVIDALIAGRVMATS